jgi:DNA polymerase III subunit beta
VEFTVNQKAFGRELAFARGVVEKNTSIPVLANVLIEARGDRVFLTATNLELSIRCSCPAHVKKEGSGTLPARKLTAYVKLLAEGDVHVRWDGAWARLTCGRSQARIAGMSRESFPEVPAIAESEGLGKVAVQVLAAMIAGTEMAISEEQSRFTLNGALLMVEGESLAMVATDGHRLAYMRASAEQSVEVDRRYRAIVPKRALEEVAKLVAGGEGDIEFGQDDNHLFFQVGEHELSARKLSGAFPDYVRVLPQDALFEVRLQKEEIRGAIERVLQFADNRSRAVRLQLTKGELRVLSSSLELGDSEEGVPVDWQGGDMEVGFNGSYLMDFLRVAPTNHVTLRFKDAKSAGELRPDATGYTGEYRYVVMPMRVA